MSKTKESKKTVCLIPKNLWNLISLALVVLFPMAYLYFRNFTLVNPQEAFNTFLLFFSGALIILAFVSLFMRTLSKSVLLVNICMLMVMLFRPIETRIVKLMPFVYYWHLIYFYISLLILIAVVVYKKFDNETIGKFNLIFIVVFGFLVLTNVLMAIPDLLTQYQKTEVSDVQLHIDETQSSSEENVYLLLFDEYSGQDALLRYTGYDNSPFYEQLTKLGFNVSPHSRNYSLNTNIEITNLLNLSLALTNENYSISAKNELLEEPALFSLFKQKEYFVNVINDQTMIPIDTKGVDRMYLGQSNLAKVETFQLVALKHSVFYPFFVAKEGDRAQEIKALLGEISSSTNLQDQRMLTVGYFMFPHMPWVLDENGNQISASEYANWKNPNAYLGQLRYISSRILEIVEEIVHKDSTAIIILLSDHGYRLPGHLEKFYGEKVADVALENDFQRNILNAVYYKGQELDIEGLSGVNTLIKVINTQFSTDLPSVELGK